MRGLQVVEAIVHGPHVHARSIVDQTVKRAPRYARGTLRRRL